MNWIIRNSKKISCHTCLDEILSPLLDYIDSYNWILSDLDGGDGLEDLPIDYEHDYFILPPKDFKKILLSKIQFNWGVIIGVPASFELKIDESNLPHAESNGLIWEDGNFQYPNSEIEIICFDSGYTIVKFTKKELSDKFKEYFGNDAIELEKFKNKYIK